MRIKESINYERPELKALPISPQGVLCQSVTGENEGFTEVPFTF